MKKITYFVILCALLFGSCTVNNLDGVIHKETPKELPDLTAGFADDETKTYVESGKYLRWHEADLISAFYGNALNRQYKFNGTTGANNGTFSLVPSGELGTGNALNAIYSVYPYDATASISDEGVISLTLPATQLYAENSFGKGANTMIAVTENVGDTFLPFKNACGYLQLKLYDPDGGEVKSIEVKGNNDEKIAGAATATIEFGGVPELSMADDGTTTVTIDCGEGVTIGQSAESATEFWIVLPEVTFSDGIKIRVTDIDGGVFEKRTYNEVIITRNNIQPMAALEAVLCAPENWKIYYTATARVWPYYSHVFGANIVSNEWEETTGEGVITFDGEVTSIGDHAFHSCEDLTSIIIPDSVTEIADRAFYACSSLTSVTIPDSVTSIGDWAFSGCTSLTSVHLTDIAAWCGISFSYYGAANPLFYAHNLYLNGELVTDLVIPDSVTSIKFSAFEECSSLTSITIPDSVTSIGDRAFRYCSSLTSITIPDSVTEIGESAFNGCSSLTSVTIPDSVTSIGSTAFYNCTSLTSFCGKYASEDGRCWIIDGVLSLFASAGLAEYTIPDSVTSIGNYAFRDCTSLTSITIPDSVTSIGGSAFSGCRSLTSITIPDSVTSIGWSAFSGCRSLTSITIPDGVTEIGDNAFRSCFSLTSVYCKAVTPPIGGSDMFDGNASGRKIYVPTESVEEYKIVNGWRDYADSIVGYDF